jgi:ankyrin repeat protein
VNPPREPDLLAAFLVAASVPRDADHAGGTLEVANALLARHPALGSTRIHAAAALGDDTALRGFLARDPAAAMAPGGPYGWDPLTHLCFSRYLRLDPARSEGFERCARALLEAGARPDTGWWEREHAPHPVWESALYGAAGVAHHAGVTRLLLAHGADPNDDETTYHAPEGRDNAAMQALVESGRMTPDSLATLLLRKADWHDGDGIAWLLAHGADPGRPTHWGVTPFQQALRRDNALASVAALLDHGADAASGAALAARRGRHDVLELLARRGAGVTLEGVDQLIAACARDDGAAIATAVRETPESLRELVAQGGALLAAFAGNDHAPGVARLLELGVDVAVVWDEGDGYWDVAPRSTALHVAAWRAAHAVVRLLIARRAPVQVADAHGRTPLVLAVRACVASYWRDRRSPQSVRALLEAGASARDVPYPCGYAEVDALLAAHGAR